MCTHKHIHTFAHTLVSSQACTFMRQCMTINVHTLFFLLFFFQSVSSFYANFFTSYLFSSSTIEIASHPCLCRLYTVGLRQTCFMYPMSLVRKKKHAICLKEKKNQSQCASAKYMISHFTEQFEQMNHQAIPQVLKSIFVHRHYVSCLISPNRHVKKYVM